MPQMMLAASAETVACNCDISKPRAQKHVLTQLDFFWSLCISLKSLCQLCHVYPPSLSQKGMPPQLRAFMHFMYNFKVKSSGQWRLKDTERLQKKLRLQLLVLVSFRWDPRPLGNFDPAKSIYEAIRKSFNFKYMIGISRSSASLRAVWLLWTNAKALCRQRWDIHLRTCCMTQIN